VPQHLLLSGAPSPGLQFERLVKSCPFHEIRKCGALGRFVHTQRLENGTQYFFHHIAMVFATHAKVRKLVFCLGLKRDKAEALVNLQQEGFEGGNGRHDLSRSGLYDGSIVSYPFVRAR
jgi:hypothetical protein